MCYHLLSVFFTLAAVPLGCFATLLAPRWDNMRVKHAWEAVPENWESLGIPSAVTTINLHLALKPHRENALVTALYEVSSPGHPKHVLSTTPLRTHVAELVMPHPHTLELVKSWLKYHGVPSSTSLTHGGNWLTLTGVSVSKANDLLGASYQLYRHTETKQIIVRTVGYSLPAALHGHVQTVAPTTFFASPRMSWQTPRKRSGGAAAEQAALTTSHPPFLRWLYNSATYVPAATGRNVLGISGFVQEYPSPVDLTTFMDHFHGTGTGATYTVVQVNSGGYDPNNPGTEANLNVQYASGIAYPTPIMYYSIGYGPEGKNDPYLSWLDFMLNLDEIDIPRTISSSYANYETELPLDHARAVCDLFMQLGARGVSVLIASGDEGVGEGGCMTDGNVRFRPTFPADSILSGGGFSEYFKRPDYQHDAATTFFEILGNQYHGIYNAEGRGFPDIAAQAFDIRIIFRNEYKVLEGNKLLNARPSWQGLSRCLMITGFRKASVRSAFSTLGSTVSPRAGLNDITSGSNPGCNTDGFSAVVGWDPVTGLGSLDFEHLQHLLL
ncbi:subtilisin-like protein [Lactarius hatsudake]|nr:subtilisin-like protein [Lactarius hatsudake]